LPSKEWDEWLSFRRKKRWPVDALTLKKQLKVLAEYDTATQRAMIDTSIQSGWQGLFPLKGRTNGRSASVEKAVLLPATDWKLGG
jgi:hypothetical protein